MPLYERHVFVCTNERADGHPRGCCKRKDAEALRDALRLAVGRAGLAKRVRVNNAGCLDQCEHGPTVVVYPDQVWYGFVTPADAEEIVHSHLVNGRPVERLRLPDACVNAAQCPHKP